MVGAEWRKAGRVYDSLQEKIKSGAYVNEEMTTTSLFAAWDALPPDFRTKIEQRIFNKQKVSVREAVDADLNLKMQTYEAKIRDYQDSVQKYTQIKEETRLEQAKLTEAKTIMKYGEALREFCKVLGLQQPQF